MAGAKLRVAVVGVLALSCSEVNAETIESALAQAYRGNPTLNQQRASVRATDESVPQALSGYRPRINGTANYGYNSTWFTGSNRTNPSSVPQEFRSSLQPRDVGVVMQQTLFNGNQTTNRVRQAEAQVIQARETLRATEQNVLLDSVTAYMNVLRDSAIVALRRQNVQALDEQRRATRDRFQVGEVTRTDVAQSEARLADAQSQLLGANAQLQTSRAQFRQVIGREPGALAPGRPVDRMLPATVAESIARGLASHPTIEAAKNGADAAQLQVRVAEASLLPTVTLEASYSRAYDSTIAIDNQMIGQVVGRLTVPIFQGGSEYSTIRQAKETLGAQRIAVDVQREQVRAAVVQSWGLLQAAKAQIEAAQAAVRANEIALEGVREEYRVGQRTLLEVLNAQTELLNSRVALVTAQRDRVVASYSLLSGTGRLSVRQLAINVGQYDETVHYQQVRDAWVGVRTPDGK